MSLFMYVYLCVSVSTHECDRSIHGDKDNLGGEMRGGEKRAEHYSGE